MARVSMTRPRCLGSVKGDGKDDEFRDERGKKKKILKKRKRYSKGEWAGGDTSSYVTTDATFGKGA